MLGFVIRLVSLAAAAGVGWLLSVLYPPPNAVVERVNPQLLRAVRDQAVEAAVSAGQMISVERVSTEEMASFADVPDWVASIAQRGSPPEQTAAGAAATAPVRLFEAALSLCPGMTVSNAPRANADRAVADFSPLADANGVALAVYPTRNACLASGFGPRGGGAHRGVDYYSATGGEILAAADGVVVEKKYRDDYGNMLLIDHGSGVYTRYAHLSTFQSGLGVGDAVNAGDVIGLMGNTASYPIPIHLHYEVLLGDYDNPRGSFGLEASNPFELPAAQPG